MTLNHWLKRILAIDLDEVSERREKVKSCESVGRYTPQEVTKTVQNRIDDHALFCEHLRCA